MPRHKGEDYKISAVKYYLKTKHQTNTCEIFECSQRSLMRWVNKYNKNKTVKRKSRKAVSYKVTQQHIKYIKTQLKTNKTISMQELSNSINDKFGIKLSRSHIASVVRDNNITLKQTRLRHEPITRYKKPIDINKQIKKFYTEIKKYKLSDIICIDETSLHSHEVRKHCYSELGKRCVIKTNNQEVFKKYTGIFAISTNGVIGYEIYEKGGINSERLVEFLKKFVLKKYKNKVIILDNASSHRNKKVKDLIQEKNKLLYSVPYQHYTNAIENFFSVLKNKLRKYNGIGYKELLKKY